MATKHNVLEIMEKHRGESVSGEYIANLLNLSRNMVWKAIKDLRKDGYVIEAATNKGYRLTPENDILAKEGIKPFLLSSDLANNIQVYAEINSTNREAKAQAIAGAPHGTVILAEQQISGRGRRDRAFFSPPGSGLYMSFILHSGVLGFHNPTTITAYAALCVCEAIEKACGLKPAIKWVNDIFLNGRKICGILTEAITVFENQHIHEIILGIGINVNTKPEDFPEPLQDIAGSLYPDGKAQTTRNRLAAEIINQLLYADKPSEAQLFEQYKARLFMLNTDVTVVQGEGKEEKAENTEKYMAKALDIDEHGRLIIQMPDGTTKTLVSGEVKVF